MSASYKKLFVWISFSYYRRKQILVNVEKTDKIKWKQYFWNSVLNILSNLDYICNTFGNKQFVG